MTAHLDNSLRVDGRKVDSAVAEVNLRLRVSSGEGAVDDGKR